MPDFDLQPARQQMLSKQLLDRGIRDTRVLAAMAQVPRDRFLPPDLRSEAYADRAVGISCGQTISQPYIVALMSQALRLSGQETVLEVGTGSGYQTAVLAELAREVYSVERHAELSRRAGSVLAELGYVNIRLRTGDGTRGWPGPKTFDRIIVTAAAEECPDRLFDQLAQGGILVIPLGGDDRQILRAIHKTAAGPREHDLSACRFVPLVGPDGGDQ